MAATAKEGETQATSKMAAVRAALKDLGNDAYPAAIGEYIKAKFDIEMSSAHISNYKTHLLRGKGKKRRKKQAAKGAEGAKASEAPKRVGAPKKTGSSVSIGDLEAVKSLVDRVGADNLKSLITLLKD
jgi:hypothetical protein